jgi:hypothetical protein
MVTDEPAARVRLAVADETMRVMPPCAMDPAVQFRNELMLMVPPPCRYAEDEVRWSVEMLVSPLDSRIPLEVTNSKGTIKVDCTRTRPPEMRVSGNLHA